MMIIDNKPIDGRTLRHGDQNQRDQKRKVNLAQFIPCIVARGLPMLLIGEKLNIHAYKKVKLAVKDRDTKFILDEARKQIDLGANVIDVHGGAMDDQMWALRTLSELKFPL